MDDPTMTERIERFLADVAPELGATVVAHTPISGGYSRVTALVEIRTADGEHQKLIMRSDPLGTMGVFDSDRDEEWALLQALCDCRHVRHPAAPVVRRDRCDARIEGDPHGPRRRARRCRRCSAPAPMWRRRAAIFLDVASALKRTPIDGLPAHLDAARTTGTATSTRRSTSTCEPSAS